MVNGAGAGAAARGLRPGAGVSGSGSSILRSEAWSATLVANRSNVIGDVGRVLVRAQRMREAGAYLHWYEQYGCEAATVDAALEGVRQVMDAYSGMFAAEPPKLIDEPGGGD